MGVLIRNGIRYSGSGSGASELADLEDVNVSSPINGQTLTYNSTTQEWENGDVSAVGSLSDLDDVDINSLQEGDVLVSDENGVYQNQPKSLYPSAPTMTWAEYQQLVDNDEDDPDAEYYIDDVDVAEAYYVETSGQTALTGATTLTFTNSHIKPTADIRILAEPASCKVSTNPQYKVSAKLSSVGNGTATITFPALAENTTFWLLIECPLAITVDPAYVYNTDETVIGQWIDGKPLYRKVFTGTTPSTPNTNTNLPHTITADMNIKRIDGTITNASGSQFPLNMQFNDGSSINTWRRTTTALGMAVYSNVVNSPYEIIIEYTKTTD